MLRAVARRRRRPDDPRSRRPRWRAPGVRDAAAPPTARHARQLQDDRRRRPRRKAISTRSRCRPTGRTTARSCRRSRRSTASRSRTTTPNGSVGRGEPGRSLAQGRPARPGRPRRQPGVRGRRSERGPVRELPQPTSGSDPGAMKDRSRPLGGRLLGRRSRSASTRDVVKNVPKTLGRPAQAGVLEPGRAERQPAHVGVGGRRRVLGGARERRLAQQRRPRASTSSCSLKDAGNFIPVQATPQTIASGQTPIVIDWDYLQPRVHQGVPGREDQGLDPDRAASTAPTTPGDQRDCTAPVGGAAVAGVPLLGRRASCSGSRGTRIRRASPTWRGGRSCRGALVRALPSAGCIRQGAVREPDAERRAAKVIAKRVAEEGRRVAP